jgi:hypothetical protein
MRPRDRIPIIELTFSFKAMDKTFVVLLLCLAAAGCETGPTQPQRPLTPIEACFTDAHRKSQSCALRAAGSGMRVGDATSSRNMQICDEQKRAQEIHCVQLYGTPAQRQNLAPSSTRSGGTTFQQPTQPSTPPMGQSLNKCQQDGGALTCLNHPADVRMPRQGRTPYQ